MILIQKTSVRNHGKHHTTITTKQINISDIKLILFQEHRCEHSSLGRPSHMDLHSFITSKLLYKLMLKVLQLFIMN